MKRLEGKVAVITGGNSGVGEKTAVLFAREGAKVIITARREELLNAVANSIKEEGGTVLAIPSDVSKKGEAEKLVEAAVSNFGKLDIWVNNAGVLDKGLLPIDKVENDEIDRLLDINTKGAMYCIRAALKEMLKAENGSIINVSSVSAVNGGGGAAYVASKAAVEGLTKHTALRCAKAGIRCNALCPGMIITPMTAQNRMDNQDADMMGAMLAHSDLTTRPCRPEEVADSILFLASDEAAPITGQCIVLDYGANL